MTAKTMTPADFKAARDRFGFTQSQMAQVLGCAASHVRRMETDATYSSHRPVPETTARLIRAYLDGYRPADWPVPARKPV